MIRVLMFGWELPPYNSGGLGTASLGLTQGLSDLGVDLDFVLPKLDGPYPYKHMRIHGAGQLKELSNESEMDQKVFGAMQLPITLPYNATLELDADGVPHIHYNAGDGTVDAQSHALWYARAVRKLTHHQRYEVIHTHDWMTYYSGLQARAIAKKKGLITPMVAHIHATEYDRGGDSGGNHAIAAIERHSLQAADRVIAVSHYTAKMVHRHYDVPMRNISVVHNGIMSGTPPHFDFAELKKHFKIVLFIGRITMQKGPDYFLKLANAVTSMDPKVKFVMVGSGDMEKQMIEQAARSGLTGKILFSSFLRGKDVDQAYQLADLFVMPSISEPFGLVALEALQNGTPAIVSKQSGVAEVSNNLIAINFWDINEMRDAVLHVLHDPQYAHELTQRGQADLQNLSWNVAAEKVHSIYQELLTPLQPAYA